ncbi:hypothetical protein TNCV_165001 [Trichonephila clavipes]|nr:hypothetical protein TNCV_165001 [Trichonephila clavipes]
MRSNNSGVPATPAEVTTIQAMKASTIAPEEEIQGIEVRGVWRLSNRLVASESTSRDVWHGDGAPESKNILVHHRT